MSLTFIRFIGQPVAP